jgi:hypothetical protein
MIQIHWMLEARQSTLAAERFVGEISDLQAAVFK